jgi:hypothetical protein
VVALIVESRTKTPPTTNNAFETKETAQQRKQRACHSKLSAAIASARAIQTTQGEAPVATATVTNAIKNAAMATHEPNAAPSPIKEAFKRYDRQRDKREDPADN